MKVCTVCHNHFLESTCSHCTDRPSTVTKTSSIALSVLLGVGLTACQTGQALYGVPYTVQDLDNDGLKDVDESEALSLKILINQVYAYHQAYPDSKIVMQADRQADWGEIYKVMMFLENNGVPNVIFSSEDPNK